MLSSPLAAPSLPDKAVDLRVVSAFLGATLLQNSLSRKSHGGCSGQWLDVYWVRHRASGPGRCEWGTTYISGLTVLRACPPAQQAGCGPVMESSPGVSGPFATRLKARDPVSVLSRGISGQRKGPGVRQLREALEGWGSELI